MRADDAGRRFGTAFARPDGVYVHDRSTLFMGSSRGANGPSIQVDEQIAGLAPKLLPLWL